MSSGEWMMYSTVHPSGNLVQEPSSSSSAAAATAGVELDPGVSKPAGNVCSLPLLILTHPAVNHVLGYGNEFQCITLRWQVNVAMLRVFLIGT